jgi:hypothetical protein
VLCCIKRETTIAQKYLPAPTMPTPSSSSLLTPCTSDLLPIFVLFILLLLLLLLLIVFRQ